jgi:hypothetical protein
MGHQALREWRNRLAAPVLETGVLGRVSSNLTSRTSNIACIAQLVLGAVALAYCALVGLPEHLVANEEVSGSFPDARTKHADVDHWQVSGLSIRLYTSSILVVGASIAAKANPVEAPA